MNLDELKFSIVWGAKICLTSSLILIGTEVFSIFQSDNNSSQKSYKKMEYCFNTDHGPDKPADGHQLEKPPFYGTATDSTNKINNWILKEIKNA